MEDERFYMEIDENNGMALISKEEYMAAVEAREAGDEMYKEYSISGLVEDADMMDAICKSGGSLLCETTRAVAAYAKDVFGYNSNSNIGELRRQSL